MNNEYSKKREGVGEAKDKSWSDVKISELKVPSSNKYVNVRSDIKKKSFDIDESHEPDECVTISTGTEDESINSYIISKLKLLLSSSNFNLSDQLDRKIHNIIKKTIIDITKLK
ncbi:MAG: hypothetical protein [Caudoviricetes sp.]|nr:MAG: hypothetical protein [Caudoviricetes sp.]